MSAWCLGAPENIPFCKQFICHLPDTTGNRMITRGSTSVNSLSLFFCLCFNVKSSSLSQKECEELLLVFALSACRNRKLDSMSWIQNTFIYICLGVTLCLHTLCFGVKLCGVCVLHAGHSQEWNEEGESCLWHTAPVYSLPFISDMSRGWICVFWLCLSLLCAISNQALCRQYPMALSTTRAVRLLFFTSQLFHFIQHLSNDFTAIISLQ